jgi:hypothetical protein
MAAWTKVARRDGEDTASDRHVVDKPAVDAGDVSAEGGAAGLSRGGIATGRR